MQRLIASVKVARCYNNKALEEGGTKETNFKVSAVDTRTRHTELSVKEVSRKFGVGLETARKTLKATTQYGIRHAVHPLSRRYRTDIMQSKRQQLNDTFYTDALCRKGRPFRYFLM
jgi:transposase